MAERDSLFAKDMAVPWFIMSLAFAVVGGAVVVVSVLNGVFWPLLPAIALFFGCSIAFNLSGWQCLRGGRDD